MNAGFKYALVACPDQYVTFQFRTYIPTGDADRGLGTNHVSLEPAFLMHQQLGERAALDTELRDWIPISGTDFAGNIIRYGAGLSYLLMDSPSYRVIPVAEFVGWTVLDGKQTAVAGDNPDVFAIQTAAGDTILNVKLGVRLGLGGAERFQRLGPVRRLRPARRASLVQDMLRVEYRLTFDPDSLFRGLLVRFRNEQAFRKRDRIPLLSNPVQLAHCYGGLVAPRLGVRNRLFDSLGIASSSERRRPDQRWRNSMHAGPL
jgi:hypothetical protein